MTDNLGRLVASPLQRGGTYCLIHSIIFCTAPTRVTETILFYLDLETSGLDLLSDEIVEMAVMSSSGHVFSTVCRPSVLPDSPSVHGISNDELKLGPDFSEALTRLCKFVGDVVEMVVVDETSDEEAPSGTILRDFPPTPLVIAHNGSKFDFPMLLSEAFRKGVRYDIMGDWKFADSLDLARLLDPGCMKLQCMVQTCLPAGDLRAHRALDDVIALREVCEFVAARLGSSTLSLFEPLARTPDLDASEVHLATLL